MEVGSFVFVDVFLYRRSFQDYCFRLIRVSAKHFFLGVLELDPRPSLVDVPLDAMFNLNRTLVENLLSDLSFFPQLVFFLLLDPVVSLVAEIEHT